MLKSQNHPDTSEPASKRVKPSLFSGEPPGGPQLRGRAVGNAWLQSTRNHAAPKVQPTSDVSDFDEQELLEMALEADAGYMDAPKAKPCTRDGVIPPSYSSHVTATPVQASVEEIDDDELMQLAFETEQDHYAQLLNNGTPMNMIDANHVHVAGAQNPASADDIDLDEELHGMLAEQQISLDPSQGGATKTGASNKAQPAKHAAVAEPVPEPDGLQQLIDEVRARYIPPALHVSDIPGRMVTVTDATGRRVYCQLLAASGLGSISGSDTGGRGRWRWMARSGRLLSRPLSELLAAAEDAQVEAAMAESKRVHAIAEEQLRKLEEYERPVPLDSAEEQADESSSTSASLWVDKYTPRSFLHLLSDDKTNREVLKWLKAWNDIVFGSANRNKPQSVMHSKDHRPQLPEYPVILMCGPPGLGKTTLAHVIAEHCGYRPLEINASDDRNSASLIRKVQDAAEMRAILGGTRPNCVIIDEIDGAMGGAEGGSAIHALVKLLKPAAKGKAEGADRTSDASGKGKKKKAHKPLGRPVICICNDLYSPALRPLREVALIFHFQAPPTEKLVARLMEICQREGVRADRGALSALANKTECDIRACLNTLQFLARQHGSRVRLKDVQGASVGQKDISKSAFTIWSELLFGLPFKGSAVKELEAAKVNRLFGLLQNYGDHEMVMSGLMDNMLSARYMDLDFKRTATMADRLADADCFIRASRARGMDMSLQAYVPACLLSLKLAMSCHDRAQLHWPRSQSELAQRQKINGELLHSWVMRMTPAVARLVRPRVAVQDLVPAFRLLTCPRVRASAPHLLQPDEQDLLGQVMQVMWAYGLTFEFPSVKEHAFPYIKEPDERPCPLMPALDTMHNYPGMPPSSGPVLAEELRRLVAQRVELEGIRRSEEARALKNAAMQLLEGQSQERRKSHRLDEDDVPMAEESTPTGMDPDPTVADVAAACTDTPMASEAPAARPSKKQNWLDAMRHPKPASKHKRAETTASNKAAERPVIDALAGDVPVSAGSHVTASAADGAFPVGPVASKAGVKRKPPAFGGFGSSKHSGANRRPKLHLPVLYKFNEGYTNAVKRPLRMHDLL